MSTQSTLPAEQLSSTLPGRLALRAREHAERVALRHKRLGLWQEISWRDYGTSVATFARMLQQWGIGAGDHVAVLSDNRPEWLYADLGAQTVGACSVGLYQTSPAKDVAYILNHCGARVLVCEDQEQVDKFMQVASDCPQVAHVVVIDPRGTGDYTEPRLRALSACMAEGRKLLQADPGFLDRCLCERDPKSPAMVVYTSGTTGTPKGALISSHNVLATLQGVVDMVGIGKLKGPELILSYLPLCHVAEKIYTVYVPMAADAIVHFGESIETVQDDLREVSPTVFLGVPRIWEKIHAGLLIRMKNSSPLKRLLFDRFTAIGRRHAAARRAGTLSPWARLQLWAGDLLLFRALQERLGMRRCRLPNSGAAPVSAELLHWFHGVGIDIREGFGMTELGGASHINGPGAEKLGTVGRPVPGVEQRLADDGELLLRGPNVFLGYLHDAEATAAAIDADGFLHTGDIGDIDSDGYLSITGRKKEIIITAGGKNLSPERIENALKTSPYLKEVIAVGDQRKFVAALVQIEYDTVGKWAQDQRIPYTSFADLASKDAVRALIDAEIRDCNETLARVEQVRAFSLLPRELNQDAGEVTATQKIRRRVVMEVFAEQIGAMYGDAPGTTGDPAGKTTGHTGRAHAATEASA